MPDICHQQSQRQFQMSSGDDLQSGHLQGRSQALMDAVIDGGGEVRCCGSIHLKTITRVGLSFEGWTITFGYCLLLL
jgi:hypothetical protein